MNLRAKQMQHCLSVNFQITDVPQIIDSISRSEQRYRDTRAQNQVLRQKLEQEIHKHDDVLVVSVPETYRNLPSKLLHLIHW
jgi:DNA-binding transcriptional MerR regulator